MFIAAEVQSGATVKLDAIFTSVAQPVVWTASAGAMHADGTWTTPAVAIGQTLVVLFVAKVAGTTIQNQYHLKVLGTVPSVTRDPADLPFDGNSAWAHPLGTGATFDVFRKGGVQVGDGGCPGADIAPASSVVWVAKASDPVRTIHYGGVDYPRHIPDAATPTGGEFVMSIIAPDHLLAFDMYNAQKQADGSWRCDGALVDVDLKGPGIGAFPTSWGGDACCTVKTPHPSNGNCLGQTRAAGVPMFAGTIRPGEMLKRIPHAIAMIFGANYIATAPTAGGYVWPSAAVDGPYPGTEVDNYFNGTLIALPPTVDIASLGLANPESVVIATAFREFGGYGVDRDDVGVMQIIIDTNAVEWQDWWNNRAGQKDLQKIWSRLRIVTNSSGPGGGAPQGGVRLNGGDGTLLAPVAPPFDR